MPEPIVGIDLGTTNSLVAIADEQGPRVLTEPDASPILPSVVRFEPDGSTTVGDDAAARAIEFPDRTITSVKRLMGRSLADARKELQYLSYTVVEGDNNTVRVSFPTDAAPHLASPEEVSALILAKLKARAETALGHPVSKAVVTVPAYFDDAQRQATRHAGRLAGLEVVRIVNEPTAAALAYGLGLDRSEHSAPRHVVVYDLGGGTFDVSLLKLTPAPDDASAPSFFQVLSTAGDTRLGGDDIDNALVAIFVEDIGRELNQPDLTIAALPADTRRALRSFAQGVKHRLSSETSATIEIAINAESTYRRTITRDQLEAMMSPLIDRTLTACARVMRDAERKLAGASIDAVILVGGSTRIPLVRSRVAEHFGVEPYTALDPDQVVALGAAVQASILSGAQRNALLLDVIPLSLGIETMGGAVAKLIMRNSTVPARASEMFSTSKDGQTSIALTVYQGEREMAEDCRKLGEFHLSGLPPMPAGIPQLKVEFLVDANGVLTVTAHERRSGKRAELQIIPNHGLTQEQVDQIERESFTHAREDMTRHRIVDLITNSKLDFKWITERLEALTDQLDADYRRSLEDQLAKLQALIDRSEADWKSVNPNEFASAKQALDEASIRLQEISIAQSLRED